MGSEQKKSFLNSLRRFFEGFLFGGLSREARVEKSYREDLFLLLTLGESLGFPFLGNYYALRLLPYQVRKLAAWQRRMVKEKDLFDRLR